jgi:alpha-1,6-mannosyltransferase
MSGSKAEILIISIPRCYKWRLLPQEGSSYHRASILVKAIKESAAVSRFAVLIPGNGERELGNQCYSRVMLKQMAWLSLAGAALELIWIGLIRLGPLRDHTAPFIALMLSAFVLCMCTWFFFPKRSRLAIWLLLGFGLLFRLTVLFAPPYQSEDVYRYIWDARVSAMGINPYSFAPNAPEIAGYRDDSVYPMINSKPYITAYPPLSQILFRLTFRFFGANVIAMKAIFSIFEFLSVLIAWRLIVFWGRSIQSLVLMAWNPFFIFEFSHSGHSDSAMMFFILLFIYLLSRRKEGLSMLCYAGAVLAKLHPALWFPLTVRRVGWKSIFMGIAAGIGLALIYFNPVSFLRYVKSLGLYYRLFEFNASIHYLIRAIGIAAFHQYWDKLIGPYLAVVLVIIIILIVCRFPIRDARDLLHAGFWIMTADLCLATTVHPWYISWAAFALPVFPYAFMAYWTGACFLSYVAYAYHPVLEQSWTLLLEYLPMYALLSWELWRRRSLMEVWLERRKS